MMSSYLLLIMCAGANVMMGEALSAQPRRRRRRRMVWTQPYLLRRDERGAYNNILHEFRMENPEKFRKCVRMDPDAFDVSTFFTQYCLHISLYRFVTKSCITS